MKKQLFSLLAVFVLMSLMLSACGGGGGSTGMKTEIGEGEGEVSIISWAGYIERGETDPNYDWVTQFKTETGCKVTNKTAATSDEMVALMNEGGFDLVTALAAFSASRFVCSATSSMTSTMLPIS